MSDEQKPEPAKKPVACTGSEFVVTPDKPPAEAPASPPQIPNPSDKTPE